MCVFYFRIFRITVNYPHQLQQNYYFKVILTCKQSNSFSLEFLNILNCINFSQHVTQHTHIRGHILDLLITHDLSTKITSVVDVDLSDFCVFFNVNGFMQRDIPERAVRKRHLPTKVAANFTDLLRDIPADILPSSCDFIVKSFNSKLRSTLDTVAQLRLKKITTHPTPPWRTEEIK